MSLGFLDRAPDARLRRAENLAREWQSHPPLKYEDPAVASYAEFLQALNSLPFQGKDRYMTMHPVMAEVHYLVGRRRQHAEQHADVNDAAAYKDRALVKALIVCKAEPEQIASHLGLKTQSIKSFEYLAFNVRSRLKERGYIHNYVLSSTAIDATGSRNFEEQLIRQAYMYGIDGVRPYLGLVVEEADLDRVQEQVRRELAMKSLTAVKALPINSHTACEVLRLNSEYAKNKADHEFRMEIAGGPGGGLINPLEEQQRILGVIGGIGLSVAPTVVESDEDKLPRIEQRVTKVFEAEVMKILEEQAEETKGAADG